LPAARVKPTTPGALYPREAYVDTEGRLISKKSPASVRQAAEKIRNRTLGPVLLPTKLLRNGVNVLAIEVHRSDFRPEALRREWDRGDIECSWAHIELRAVRLTGSGKGLVPNVSRPKGFQVFNQDIHRVFCADEYGDPNEPLRPIRLVGVRNGFYSGAVVVSRTGSIRGLKGVISDLRQPAGKGLIPAADVRVRCAALSRLAVPAVQSGLTARLPVRKPAFMALQDQPPTMLSRDSSSGAAVQPVWVVPRDAPAGNYRGSLTLTAEGLPATKVPIELEVIDWTLPDAKDFHTFIGIYQSPESLAFQYDVPMWSEAHWRLLERSFRLLGYLSNNLLVIPLVNRTQFGNDECMLPWMRKADGSYDYDFAVHDRYLDLAMKYCNLKVISYQVWTPYGGGYHKPQCLATKPTFVTVVDPAKGERGSLKLPAFGTDEAKRLWKPLIDAVRARLRKRGLERAFVFGLHSDSFTTHEVTDQFNAIFPNAGWHRAAHGRGRPRTKFARYDYREYMYVPNVIPLRRRRLGWPGGPLVAMSQRLYDPWQPPRMMRTMAERALLIGDSGAGRMCLDYWPVKGSTRLGSLFNRWLESSSQQRRPFLRYLALPGKQGAVSTIRIEAMREGLQETEARVFVEEALMHKRITGALAEKCRRLLKRRDAICRIVHSSAGYGITAPLRVTYGKGSLRVTYGKG